MWHDRFIAWFARVNGSKRCFYGSAALIAVYLLCGQRLPGLPHLPSFDPYPFIFLTFALSLWANLQNIALQYTGQGITDHAIEIQRRQEAHLAHIERLLTSNEEQ